MEKREQDILEEIRNCYNKGLLSALVGAGFSKNVSDSFLGEKPAVTAAVKRA